MSSNKGVYIVIEGNIGAGKSTLAKALTELSHGEFLPEPADGEGREFNPFLKPYYLDPQRWGYTMQVHLLAARYRAHQYAQAAALYKGGTYIGDRSYFGDCCFATMLHNDGLMNDVEYQSYLQLHKSMQAQLLYPTVAVFLHTKPENCKKRIEKRLSEREGRQCECGISLDYLMKLQNEIDKLEDELKRSGCFVISLDLNKDGSIEDVERVATQILNTIKVSDLDETFPAWCGIKGEGI